MQAYEDYKLIGILVINLTLLLSFLIWCIIKHSHKKRTIDGITELFFSSVLRKKTSFNEI